MKISPILASLRSKGKHSKFSLLRYINRSHAAVYLSVWYMRAGLVLYRYLRARELCLNHILTAISVNKFNVADQIKSGLFLPLFIRILLILLKT
jgi:hypothetical protein